MNINILQTKIRKLYSLGLVTKQRMQCYLLNLKSKNYELDEVERLLFHCQMLIERACALSDGNVINPQAECHLHDYICVLTKRIDGLNIKRSTILADIADVTNEILDLEMKRQKYLDLASDNQRVVNAVLESKTYQDCCELFLLRQHYGY